MKPRILDRCSNCGVRTTQLWPLAGPNEVVARHCANCYPHTVPVSESDHDKIVAWSDARSYAPRTDEHRSKTTPRLRRDEP